MNDLSKLQQQLNYTFKDISLLKRALTHKSYARANYERLEFVGDGVLGYVIAINLYDRYPELSEGELSRMRASVVNQEYLVGLALELDLGKYLFLGDGEEKSGGRKRASILADVLEAIFAAVSLDSSFEVAQLVIEHLYKDRLDNLQYATLKDSKSKLQELLQAKKISLPVYDVIEVTGPDHDGIFRVECVVSDLKIKVAAMGKTKKDASQVAASLVLKRLTDDKGLFKNEG
jgi:ribonuclease III